MPNDGSGVISPRGTPCSSNSAAAATRSAWDGTAEAEVIKTGPVLAEPVAGRRHRPQSHDQFAAAHHDAAEQNLEHLGGGRVVIGRRLGDDLEAEQPGVERPAPGQVGDGEPEVVDAAYRNLCCHCRAPSAGARCRCHRLGHRCTRAGDGRGVTHICGAGHSPDHWPETVQPRSAHQPTAGPGNGAARQRTVPISTGAAAPSRGCRPPERSETTSEPDRLTARSASPRNPDPAGSAPPGPSSRTSTSSPPSARQAVTSIAQPPPCLTAFVISSQAANQAAAATPDGSGPGSARTVIRGLSRAAALVSAAARPSRASSGGPVPSARQASSCTTPASRSGRSGRARRPPRRPGPARPAAPR